MRFSLLLEHREWVRGGGSEATLRRAENADQGGIDSLWVTEDPDGWDAFALLGAISQRTNRIRLGTGVTNPYLRHPNLIAASVATLDRLAPGRAFLGIGRGQPEWYEHGLGIPAGSPVRRLEESIGLLRQWWSPPGSASSNGEFVVDGWQRVVEPLSIPPIYIAAVGPRALDIAGRDADGVLFSALSTLDYVRGAIDRVRAAAKAGGRDPNAIEFFADPGVLVTGDPGPSIAGRKRFLANVLTLPGMETVLENPEIDVPGIMRRVRAHMKTDELLASGGAFAAFAAQGDIDAAVAEIPDAMVLRGSAIGSLADVRERIETYRELGVTELFLSRSGLPPDGGGIETLLSDLRG